MKRAVIMQGGVFGGVLDRVIVVDPAGVVNNIFISQTERIGTGFAGC
ncbi:MAG: hypothetical protein JXD23_14870 [Spirochaetales bacterium]|nr:hypothetical protein [Spirochaetales bacterium]